MLGFGLVHRSNPKAPQRIALAIVGTHGGGVIRKRGDLRQRAAPLMRPENAVAQGDDQAAAARRGNATGLGRHIPGLQSACVPAQQLFAGNIDPIQALLLRMPKR